MPGNRSRRRQRGKPKRRSSDDMELDLEADLAKVEHGYGQRPLQNSHYEGNILEGVCFMKKFFY